MRSFGEATKGLPFFSIFSPSHFLDQVDFDKIAKNVLGCDFETVTVDSNTIQSYYSKEFGPEPLTRLLVFGKEKKQREHFVQMKITSEKIEQQFSENEKRKINIDPGHIYLEQVLLATLKPYSHRIFIKNNIYAELVYQFVNKTWEPLPWCYPDYCTPKFREIFLEQRSFLKKI